MFFNFSDKSDLPTLRICTRCRLVHDGLGGWLTTKAYRDAMGIDPLSCRLKNDYCPACYEYLFRNYKLCNLDVMRHLLKTSDCGPRRWKYVSALRCSHKSLTSPSH